MIETPPTPAQTTPDGSLISEQSIETPNPQEESLSIWLRLWQTIQQRGLTDPAMRIATGLASVTLVLVAVWVMNSFFLTGTVNNPQMADFLPNQLEPTLPAEANPDQIAFSTHPPSDSIPRLIDPHTSLPVKPRSNITHYTVAKGDTIFAISAKFNLKPQTILWGNYDVLA